MIVEYTQLRRFKTTYVQISNSDKLGINLFVLLSCDPATHRLILSLWWIWPNYTAAATPEIGQKSPKKTKLTP